MSHQVFDVRRSRPVSTRYLSRVCAHHGMQKYPVPAPHLPQPQAAKAEPTTYFTSQLDCRQKSRMKENTVYLFFPAPHAAWPQRTSLPLDGAAPRTGKARNSTRGEPNAFVSSSLHASTFNVSSAHFTLPPRGILPRFLFFVLCLFRV